MSEFDDYVRCGCGDMYPPKSYGAGFIAANGGVCENCDMYEQRISISAKAGRAFAKAQARRTEAFSANANGERDIDAACEAQQEWDAAARELGHELMASGHHEAEGD